jgi:tetratricopeptide (TPR) repeat protein
VDREFAFGLIPDLTPAPSPIGRRGEVFTQHDLTSRAADFFAAARKPRAEWKKLDDLSAQLAEFDLRCAADDYDTAGDIISDIDYDCLQVWGHYRLLINYYEGLQGKLKSSNLKKRSLNELGLAYNAIGSVRKCIECYESALKIVKEEKDRSYEGVLLGNLGGAYAALGDARQAIEFYEQALVIDREIGDQRGEGNHLGNLGGAYAALGDARQAIEFYEQALVIAREIGDRRGEGNHLGNLGSAYAALGDARQAIEFDEQALVIAREIGDRRGEGSRLGNLGNRYADLGDARQAIEFHEQALVIAREIGDRRGEGADMSNIAGQYSNLAEYEKSIDYYNQALKNAREIGNKYGESKRLNGLAGVLIEKGDFQNAITHSKETLRIGQEISSPEVCVECSNVLTKALLFSDNLKDVQQIAQDARRYDQPHFIFNDSVLHGIIAFRQGEQGDEVTARQAFTRAIAQADEILAKTPDYYDALDAKGLALCGLALCAEDDGRRTEDVAAAMETFRKARKIAPHAGVVKSVLRLFDELAKCDEDGLLQPVRAAVEGKE